MKKLVFLLALFNLKLSHVLAYHGTETTGGSSLPVYESSTQNLMYLIIPFLLYSLVLHQLMQTYLDRRYVDNRKKSGENYRDITLLVSAVLTFLLMFTDLFHALPTLSITNYSILMGVLAVIFLTASKRKKLAEIYREKLGSEE